MTDSYYTGNPDTIIADKVRLLIGDTDNPGILKDNEITLFLHDANNDVVLAAIFACDSLISRFAKKVNKKIADQSINYSDLVDHYESVRNNLKERYETSGFAIPSPKSSNSEQEYRFTSKQFDNS